MTQEQFLKFLGEESQEQCLQRIMEIESEIKKTCDGEYTSPNEAVFYEVGRAVLNPKVEQKCFLYFLLGLWEEALNRKKNTAVRYVCGFLFDGNYVLLIRKTKPQWQSGKLNGVGGKIEKNESPHEAMKREFKEEAGLELDTWKPFVILRDKDAKVFEVHFFCADLPPGASVCSKTEEKIQWCVHSELPDDVIPNLKWLIPLSRPFTGDTDADTPIEVSYK